MSWDSMVETCLCQYYCISVGRDYRQGKFLRMRRNPFFSLYFLSAQLIAVPPKFPRWRQNASSFFKGFQVLLVCTYT